MSRAISRIRPSEVHRLRYAKNKHLGLKAEEIAKQERVALRTVEDSIAAVELYHGVYNLKEVEASQAEILILNRDLELLAIRRGLTAERIIRDEEGKEIAREPDHETRIEVLRIEADLLKSLEASRGPRVNQTKVQVGVGVTTTPSAPVGAQSFENRLREITMKRRDEILSQPQPALPVGSESVEEVTPDWDDDTEEEAEK